MPNHTLFSDAYHENYHTGDHETQNYMLDGMTREQLNRILGTSAVDQDEVSMDFDDLKRREDEKTDHKNRWIDLYDEEKSPVRKQVIKTLYEMKRSGMANGSSMRAGILNSESWDNLSSMSLAESAKAILLRERLAKRGPLADVRVPFKTGLAYAGISKMVEDMNPEKQRQLLQEVPNMLKDKFLYDADPISEVPSYNLSELSASVTLSDHILDGLKGAAERLAAVRDTVEKYVAQYPNRTPEEWGSTDDFCALIDTDILDKREIIEKTNMILNDYYDLEHPEKRVKILDDFYDRVDHCDVRSSDLSVLIVNPPVDDEKKEKSEDDVIKLYQRVAYHKAAERKLVENVAYAHNRYHNPMAGLRFENQLAMMMVMDTYLIGTVLTSAGYKKDGMGESLDDEVKMGTLQPDGILPFLTTEPMAEMLEIEKAARPLHTDISRNVSKQLHEVFGPSFDLDKKDWKKGGIDQLSQIFYIDGKSVEELYGSNYQNLGQEEKDQAMEAEIMSAILSGEHHVDIAVLMPTKQGSLDIQMYALKTDLSNLNQKQRESGPWYQTLNSKKAEKLWNHDKERTARLKGEKTAISEKMIAALQKNIIEKEARSQAEVVTPSAALRQAIDLDTLSHTNVATTTLSSQTAEPTHQRTIGR